MPTRAALDTVGKVWDCTRFQLPQMGFREDGDRGNGRDVGVVEHLSRGGLTPFAVFGKLGWTRAGEGSSAQLGLDRYVERVLRVPGH